MKPRHCRTMTNLVVRHDGLRGNADVWGRVCSYLPLQDVASLTDTNSFFRHDVCRHVETLWIDDARTLRAALAKRFTNGVVREIYILSLIDYDRDLGEAKCNRPTAMALPSFLSFFNQQRLCRVFVGGPCCPTATTITTTTTTTAAAASTAASTASLKRPRNERFSVFPPTGGVFFVLPESYGLHRRMVLALLGAVESGALSSNIDWSGLCEGWRCGKIVCSCHDLLSAMPMTMLVKEDKARKGQLARRLCLDSTQIQEIMDKRMVQTKDPNGIVPALAATTTAATASRKRKACDVC